MNNNMRTHPFAHPEDLLLVKQNSFLLFCLLGAPEVHKKYPPTYPNPALVPFPGTRTWPGEAEAEAGHGG